MKVGVIKQGACRGYWRRQTRDTMKRLTYRSPVFSSHTHSAGGGGAGQPAKDANGNDIKSKAWLKTHLPGDYSLTQGLKGDATYLIVKGDGTLTEFGLNAVCTHLGCVVPWNKAENKFKCPCHGSQYNADGKGEFGLFVRSFLRSFIYALHVSMMTT